MLEQLQEIVRHVGQQTVVENPAVPNDQNEAVLQETNQSIFGGLQQMVQQQGVGGLTQLFQGVQGENAHANPGVQQLSGNVAGNLTSKLGINSATAQQISTTMIPQVIGKLFHRTKDPNDKGLDIGSVLSSLGAKTAGNTGGAQTGGLGLGGMLNKVGGKLGLDKDGDGDTDLNDLMKMFR